MWSRTFALLSLCREQRDLTIGNESPVDLHGSHLSMEVGSGGALFPSLATTSDRRIASYLACAVQLEIASCFGWTAYAVPREV